MIHEEILLWQSWACFLGTDPPAGKEVQKVGKVYKNSIQKQWEKYQERKKCMIQVPKEKIHNQEKSRQYKQTHIWQDYGISGYGF